MDPKSLCDLQKEVYNKMRLYRRLHYTISESTSFNVAWDSATDREKEMMSILIKDANLDGLNKYIREICHSELETKGVDELRKIANRYGFTGLSRHVKSSLLSMIYGAQKNEEVGSN